MRSVDASLELRRLAASPVGLGALLAAIGLLTWVSLSIWCGMSAPDETLRLRGAWDTSCYYYVGLPIMAAAVALAAFLQPERSWRWALWLVGGHQLGVLLVGVGMQSVLSLLILTIMFAVLLAAAFAVPAMLGAMAARALAARAY
jgi:hypothetical protein